MRTPIDILSRADDFGDPRERPNVAYLRKVEASLGRKMPDGLRSLLLTCGGMEFLGYCRTVAGEERDVRGILGNGRSQERSVRDAISIGLLPPGFIPFADDDGDNIFALRDDGKVVWFQHDAPLGDSGELVADSLDEWLRTLVVGDDTEGGNV